MLHSMSLLVALFGHGLMSDLSPLLGEERKSNFGVVRSVDDPIETLVPHDGDRFGLRRQKRRSRAYTSELGQAEESLSRLR